MEKETSKNKVFNYQTVILVVLILIVAGVLILLQTKDRPFDSAAPSRIAEGMRAPDVSLPALDGKRVRLKDYRGKVVLLNVWATWCPPCVEEMPSMQRLYQASRGKDFEILAVSVDKQGAEVVAPFMQKHRLTFPVLVDPKASIQSLYGTMGVPESFIIDKQGIVQKVVIGPIDWYAPEVVAFLQDLLDRPV